MQKSITVLIVCMIIWRLSEPLRAESIELVSETSLTEENAPFIDSTEWPVYISGCHVSGDTVVVASNVGLLIKYPDTDNWMTLIDYRGGEDDYRTLDIKIQSGKYTYYPGYIQKMTGHDRYTVFPSLGLTPYVYEVKNRTAAFVEWHEIENIYTHLQDIGIGKDVITYGVASDEHDTIISVSNVDFSDYRRVYQMPAGIKAFLDSVGAFIECHPTFNPKDNSILFALSHFNWIYKIDTTGRLLDSILIDAESFLVPRPPASRLKTNAVFQDWLSRCTPIQRFAYVHPGYLIAQYSTYTWQPGDNYAERKSMPTLVWRTDKTPVDIEINDGWQLVQVQPDGLIVFSEQIYDNDSGHRTILYITRIRP